MEEVILTKEFSVKNNEINFIKLSIFWPKKLDSFRYSTEYIIETNINIETNKIYGYDEWQSFFLAVKYLQNFMLYIQENGEIYFDNELILNRKKIFEGI